MNGSMSPVRKSYIENVCSRHPEYNQIDAKHFDNPNVKRGLRNADGTGVVAGLTKIGHVHGYIISEYDRMPVEGELFYRGIKVNEIIDGCQAEDRYGFEEISFLLLFGHLPNRAELEEFMEIIGECRMLPENFTEDMIIKAPSRDIMNKLARAILALYSYDENPDDNSLPNMMRQSIELIARFPTIVAHAYQVKKHYYDSKSMYIHFPRNNLSTAENFLRTIRSDKKFTPTEARLLDLSLILHAEHGGGNNSAFAARLLSSTGTDTYSAISAAVGSLKGPKHGGANIKVNGMFDHIKANIKDWEDDDEILAFLKKIINKEAGDGSGLIYGIGHAVYTISDPRAVILRDNARLLAKEKGMETEFNLLNAVERLAPTAFNEVRGEKKVMCANVDLYSGMVYRMLNIPPELFTPLFAIARIAGWAAHRIEEITTNGKIMRPAYKFVGDLGRYTPLDER